MEVTNPKVSVIMSVYNGEKHLQEAVDSILNQTFKNFEFIVINDGSTDSTAEILKSFFDERMIIINQDNRRGLTKSLNRAVSSARGEYVARMDADDVSLPERLGQQVAFLDEHTDVALLGCNFYEIDDSGNIVARKELIPENEEIKWRLLFHNCYGHSTTIFRKECFSAVDGYDESIFYSQDYDLWIRLSQHYNLGNLCEFLHKWRRNESKGISMINFREQHKSASAISDRALQQLLPHECLNPGLLRLVRDYVSGSAVPADLRSVEEMLFKIMDSFWNFLFKDQHNLKKKKLMQSRYYMDLAFLYYDKDQPQDFRRCALRGMIDDARKMRVGILFLIATSFLGKSISDRIQVVKNKMVR